MKTRLFYASFLIYLIFFPLIPSRLNMKYPVTEVMLLIVLVLYLIDKLTIKEKQKIFIENLIVFLKEPFSLFAFIIFVLMAVSISYSTSKLLAMKETLRFSIALGLYFVIRFELDLDFHKEKIVRLIYYPAFVVMIIGFCEKFFIYGKFSNNSFVHYARIILFENLPSSLHYRVESTTGNSNIYGGYLVLLFFPLLVIAIEEKRKKRRFFYAVELLMFLYSIYLCYSRNAWLSLAAGLLLICLYYYKKLIFIVAPLMGILAFIPSIHSRITYLSDAGRLKIWYLAIEVIKEHPVIGVAIGNFEAVHRSYALRFPKYNSSFEVYHTHNILLKIMSELGIIGTIPFVVFFIVAIYKSFTAISKSSGVLKSFSLGTAISFVVFIIISIFDNVILLPKVMNYYFIFSAVIMYINSRQSSRSMMVIDDRKV